MGCVFLVAQVGQNVVDNVMVLNAGNDLYRLTAAGADRDVYIEYAFEPLSPGHRSVTLGS